MSRLTFQYAFNGRGLPLSAAYSRNAAPVQLACDGAQAYPLAVQIGDDGAHLGAVGVEAGRCDRAGLPCSLGGARVAQPGAACLRHCQRLCGALADRLAFVFRDGGKDMEGKAVRLGHIAGGELYAAFHQPGNEMHVAGEPVQLGNDEPRPALTAKGEGGGKLGAVVLPSAFYLGELGEGFAPACEVSSDGGALGVQS